MPEQEIVPPGPVELDQTQLVPAPRVNTSGPAKVAAQSKDPCKQKPLNPEITAVLVLGQLEQSPGQAVGTPALSLLSDVLCDIEDPDTDMLLSDELIEVTDESDPDESDTDDGLCDDGLCVESVDPDDDSSHSM